MWEVRQNIHYNWIGNKFKNLNFLSHPHFVQNFHKNVGMKCENPTVVSTTYIHSTTVDAIIYLGSHAKLISFNSYYTIPTYIIKLLSAFKVLFSIVIWWVKITKVCMFFSILCTKVEFFSHPWNNLGHEYYNIIIIVLGFFASPPVTFSKKDAIEIFYVVHTLYLCRYVTP